MNNLTHYQNRIYDKLLPELGKIEPYKEVYLYTPILSKDRDKGKPPTPIFWRLNNPWG
jgi:hypothetical protein